jgi:hypothetical protein
VAVHAVSGGRQDTAQDKARDFGNGAAEWYSWYTQYLTRATGQSARTLELYQEVLECVRRGALAPTALHTLSTGFAQARGTDYAAKLAEVGFRFLRGLMEIGGAYAREQAELAIPGAALPPIKPPQFDAADPMRWFGQLAEYASELNARAVKAYQAQLERVAGGQTTPTQLHQAASDYAARRLPDHLRQAGRLYFDLLNDLNDLRGRYEEEYLAGVLASADRQTNDAAFVLHLVAPLGGTASASLALTNTRETRAVIRCSVTDVRRADGVGPTFAPKITITPEALELKPGAEGSVRLSLELDPADYDADALYVGAVFVTGHGEPRLEVPLRITATQPATAKAQP